MNKSQTEKLEAVHEKMALNHKGHPMEGNLLYPDPTPMAPPIGYKKQPSMIDIIRDQVRMAGLTAEKQGFENFDDASDFDIGDDYEPSSPHEMDETEEETPPSVLRARAKEANKPPKGDTPPKTEKPPVKAAEGPKDPPSETSKGSK